VREDFNSWIHSKQMFSASNHSFWQSAGDGSHAEATAFDTMTVAQASGAMRHNAPTSGCGIGV
jgi:hypothetical protein